jgi:hypothetical protein
MPVGAHQTFCKKMERREYPGCRGYLFSRFALIGFLTAVPAFALGMYLRLLHDTKWALPVFGILGITLFGVCAEAFRRRAATRLPCPVCRRTDLAQRVSNEPEECYLLVCDTCQIEWETGFGVPSAW